MLDFNAVPPGPNEKHHWRTRALHNKVWRERARHQAVLKQVPSLSKVRLTGIVYRRNLGVSDEDNDHARFKPLVDGLRDARVIKNDTRGYVFWSATLERHGPPGVQLLIEEAKPCSRCGGFNETQECLLNIRLCLKCYALLVGTVLRQNKEISMLEVLEKWLERTQSVVVN